MKKSTMLKGLLIILAVSMLFCSVSAQDAGTEQPTGMLRSIFQKYRQEETDEPTAMPLPEITPEPTATVLALEVPDPTEEPVKFQVYANKKLMSERIPDANFVQKSTGEEQPDDDAPKHYEGEPCNNVGGTWSFFNGHWECANG